MSLIPIVDTDDNIITYKERDLLEANDICRVSALWITNSSWKILLAQRHRTKKRSPICWWPAVAWTVEKGETYEENIKRETTEEIGLTGKVFSTGPKIKIPHPQTYFTQWFLLNEDLEIDKLKIQEDEVESLRWISPPELKQEFAEHPDKFVPSFPIILPLFL